MKRLGIGVCAFGLLAAAPGFAQEAEISPNGSRESIVGANEHMQTTGGNVTFAPGARSAWHTHPAGQILIVTSGKGWVQEEGGEKRVIEPGDVIWTPPDVKHWHGATATNSMSHIALTNVEDGENVVWMEKVSDEQYLAQ